MKAEKFVEENASVTHFPAAASPPKPRPKFEMVPFHQIKLSRRARMLVKGFLPENAMCLIWGRPKCGKSFFAVDIALHLALGWEYRGRKVRGGPVVYCALEGSSGYGARIEAFRQHHVRLARTQSCGRFVAGLPGPCLSASRH